MCMGLVTTIITCVGHNCLFIKGVMLISCTKCGFVKLIERIACSLSLLLMQLRTSVKCNY